MGPAPRSNASKIQGEAQQTVFLTSPLGNSDAGSKLRTTNLMLISATALLCSDLPSVVKSLSISKLTVSDLD